MGFFFYFPLLSSVQVASLLVDFKHFTEFLLLLWSGFLTFPFLLFAMKYYSLGFFSFDLLMFLISNEFLFVLFFYLLLLNYFFWLFFLSRELLILFLLLERWLRNFLLLLLFLYWILPTLWILFFELLLDLLIFYFRCSSFPFFSIMILLYWIPRLFLDSTTPKGSNSTFMIRCWYVSGIVIDESNVILLWLLKLAKICLI